MPPETLPSQAASSGFPCLFMEAPAEVTGTSPVRLTFGSYSCLVHHTRPLKLSRHCSLLFARTCSFLFSFSVTSPPESGLGHLLSALCPHPHSLGGESSSSGPTLLKKMVLSLPRHLHTVRVGALCGAC